MADTEPASFAIYRGTDAKEYGEHDVLRMDDITPAIAEGLTHFHLAADGTHGQVVKLLFGAPGVSLSHVWFKSGYPLPLHAHSSDCLYYILAGTLRMGTEELGAGDGFFVGTDVPYTYTAGPEGVEVLEFRNTDQINIRFMARNKAFWERAAQQIGERRESWRQEPPPSAKREPTPAG